MLSSSGPSAIHPVLPSSALYAHAAERETVTRAPSTRNFDSLILSSSMKGDRMYMDTVGRLSQEVRTATTTGDIHALQQQVSSGQYTPDPMSIAARILFLGEEV